jgi:hypothetical protein
LAGVFTSIRSTRHLRKKIALADFDPQANDLLAKMTLDEKVGQMTQAHQQFLKSLDDIEKISPWLGVERRRFGPEIR